MIYGCIDLETTGLVNGLNREQGQETHEICEISMALFDNETFKIYDKFTSYIKPMNPDNIDEKAMKINQIPMSVLNNAPTPMEVRHNFYEWASSHGEKIVPCGWNFGDFDKGFLVPFLGWKTYDAIFHYHSCDAKTMMYTLRSFTEVLDNFDLDGNSLKEFCECFDIPHKAHDAFGDVYATIMAFKRLKQVIEMYSG